MRGKPHPGPFKDYITPLYLAPRRCMFSGCLLLLLLLPLPEAFMRSPCTSSSSYIMHRRLHHANDSRLALARPATPERYAKALSRPRTLIAMFISAAS
jgi:hypothetical protein